MQLILWMPNLEPKAKARPRVTSRGTYMPEDYQDWRRRFVAAVWDQWRGEPFGHFEVVITVATKTGRMRPDLDNVIGACLDALQDAGVVANDRMCWKVTGVIVRDTPGITIEILG